MAGDAQAILKISGLYSLLVPTGALARCCSPAGSIECAAEALQDAINMVGKAACEGPPQAEWYDRAWTSVCRVYNWICFFLCALAYGEQVWLQAPTHGPIYQGVYVQMILLFFHFHVNIGFETMRRFLQHCRSFDSRSGIVPKGPSLMLHSFTVLQLPNAAQEVTSVNYFAVVQQNRRLLGRRDTGFQVVGQRIGRACLVLTAAVAVSLPLWLSWAAFSRFYMRAELVQLKIYGWTFGIQMTIEALISGACMWTTLGLVAMVMRSHLCDILSSVQELSNIRPQPGVPTEQASAQCAEAVTRWMESHIVVRKLMQASERLLRLCVLTATIFAAGGCCLTFLTIYFEPEQIRTWPVFKVIMVGVVLTLGYASLVYIFYLAMSISEGCSSLKEAANDVAPYLAEDQFHKLQSFVEVEAQCGWHVIAGMRVSPRAFVVTLLGGAIAVGVEFGMLLILEQS